jgi:hypothetical protein
VPEDGDDDELARILAPFRDMKVETGPVTLSDDYLRMIDEVEAAPENQSGADKTWVWDADRRYRDYFARLEG